jgi:peptidoglycan hydrolase-like protein with peptidoglycan-binding domain
LHLSIPELLFRLGSVLGVKALRSKVLAFLIIAALFSANSLYAKTASRSASKVTAKKSSAKTKKVRSKRGSWRTRGQKQIADDRTREIQSALVREGYLDGEPTGVMDAKTKAALQKLQAENGWQTRIVPDSRALIKLGLGPDQSNVINPATAAFASPVLGTSAVAGVGNQQ